MQVHEGQNAAAANAGVACGADGAAGARGGIGAPAVKLVKWETPTDELLGVAKIARCLAGRPGTSASDVCIAVPNRVWAAQAQRACASIGLEAVVCAPAARLGAAARAALAKLAVLAQPDDEKALAAWEAAGLPADEASAFAQAYREARGFTLVRVLGLDAVPEASTALLHVRGDEAARELQALMEEQLARPTLPSHSAAVPVCLIGSLERPCEHLFLVGCVDGLVPSPAAGAQESAREQELREACAAERAAFERALSLARTQAVVSVFCKVDARIAEQARIRCVRFKTEHGARMAHVAPTPFLREAGGARPTTMGGQAYLRSYNLN